MMLLHEIGASIIGFNWPIVCEAATLKARILWSDSKFYAKLIYHLK